MPHSKNASMPKMDAESCLSAMTEKFPATDDTIQKACAKYGWDPKQAIDTSIGRGSTMYSVYPESSDPNFANRLNAKKEFGRSNLETLSSIEDLCPADTRPFSMLASQEYLVNFMAPHTPYRSLLMFHGVGAGKTATAVAIAEGLKEVLHRNPVVQQRRVLVLHLSNSINSNFRNTIYRPRAEALEIRHGMRPGSLQVTSDEYYPDDGAQKTSARHRSPSGRATQEYEAYYEFMSADGLKKKVETAVRNARLSRPRGWKSLAMATLADEFSNRLIIVDEAHNLKSDLPDDLTDATHGMSEESAPQRVYSALWEVLRSTQNVRLLLMTATPMFDSPTEMVSLLNLLLLNDKRPLVDVDSIFPGNAIDPARIRALGKQVAPYVSYWRGYNPLSFPKQREINDPEVKQLYRHNTIYLPRPKQSAQGLELGQDDLMQYTILIKCPMSDFQFFSYAVGMQDMKGDVADNLSKSLCTFAFPPDATSTGVPGEEGFSACFESIANDDDRFRYKPHSRGILELPDLQKFSAKYYQILVNVLISPGIAFVYSENIKVGVLTLGMMLDANGYDRDGGGHCLVDHRCAAKDKRCSVCNLTASARVHGHRDGHTFRQAHYVILQAQDDLHVNSRIIERLKAPGNRNGEEIKVVLGSPVTKESMDFSNVRQIHIATVWYNMSRTTQIIGRGVRNCSHRNLPLQDRDVVVFRYCTSPPTKQQRDVPALVYVTETGDEKCWRLSELKDRAIKCVEREIKRNAFDCQVHKHFNQFASDHDFTRDCEYDTCRYTCRSEHLPACSNNARDTTYELLMNRNEIENVKFSIAKLYETRNVYTFEDIKVFHRANRRRVSDRSIALALQDILDGQHGPELIRGRNGALGHLIYVSKYYVFQPLSALDVRIPLSMRSLVPHHRGRSGKANLIQDDAADDKNTIRQADSRTSGLELLKSLDRIPDQIMQFREMDYVLCGDLEAHRQMLEAIIQDNTTHHLLKYYTNFLLYDDDNIVIGHFIGQIVRRLTKAGSWVLGNASDHRRMNALVSSLYAEPEADFVGYVEAPRQKQSRHHVVTFKIINNAGQVEKPRLNLQRARNSLATGKTCQFFERSLLNSIAKFLGVTPTRTEQRVSLCERIEYGFRKKQLESLDGRRHFLNTLETAQRKGIATNHNIKDTR